MQGLYRATTKSSSIELPCLRFSYTQENVPLWLPFHVSLRLVHILNESPCHGCLIRISVHALVYSSVLEHTCNTLKLRREWNRETRSRLITTKSWWGMSLDASSNLFERPIPGSITDKTNQVCVKLKSHTGVPEQEMPVDGPNISGRIFQLTALPHHWDQRNRPATRIHLFWVCYTTVQQLAFRELNQDHVIHLAEMATHGGKNITSKEWTRRPGYTFHCKSLTNKHMPRQNT